MEEDLVLKRLASIYCRKLARDYHASDEELTEEEFKYIIEHLDQLLESGKMNDTNFKDYVVRVIGNPYVGENMDRVFEMVDGVGNIKFWINSLKLSCFDDLNKLSILQHLRDKDETTRSDYLTGLYYLSDTIDGEYESILLCGLIEKAKNYKIEDKVDEGCITYSKLVAFNYHMHSSKIYQQAAETVLSTQDDILKFFNENDSLISNGDKNSIIYQSDDAELIKRYLQFNQPFGVTVANLLHKIGDKDFSTHYIDAIQDENIKMRLAVAYSLLDDDTQVKNQVNEKITNIKKLSELPTRDAAQLADNQLIWIAPVGHEAPMLNLYTKKQYLEIMDIIDKKFGHIPQAIKGNVVSEVNTFLAICDALSSTSYNFFAASPLGKNDENLVYNSRNLYGALVEDSCVCAGYAIALDMVSELKGLDTNRFSGLAKSGYGGHAWNQVRIGDRWLNVDYTNVRDLIYENHQNGKAPDIHVLMSDDEFINVLKRYEFTGGYLCPTSIEDILPRDLKQDERGYFIENPGQKLANSIKAMINRYRIKRGDLYTGLENNLLFNSKTAKTNEEIS